MTFRHPYFGAPDKLHAPDHFVRLVEERCLAVGRAVVAQQHDVDARFASLDRDFLQRGEPVGHRGVDMECTPQVVVRGDGLVPRNPEAPGNHEEGDPTDECGEKRFRTDVHRNVA